MRKLLTALTLLFLLLTPAKAQAQNAPSLENLNIRLWSEYDQPAVLAIVNFNISSATPLPAIVTFKIPNEASLTAIAHDTVGGLLNIPYETSKKDGYQLLSLNIEDTAVYHFEYYFPFTKTNNQRGFTFVMPLDYAVKTLTVEVQHPVGASDIQTTPASGLPFIGDDGMNYQTATAENLSAGSVYSFEVSYTKSDDVLSASSLQVQPVGDLSEDNTAMTFSAKAVGGILLGVALIVAGIWFWRNNAEKAPRPRKKRRPRGGQAPVSDDEAIYCSQCGKRAQSADKFCRTCGASIHKEE